jgi:hypothetical protein
MYEPGHTDICPKKQKPQINALVVNDLEKTEITEDMLNQLAVEDALTEYFGQLSLNALSSSETKNSIKLKAMVKDSDAYPVGLRKLSQLCQQKFCPISKIGNSTFTTKESEASKWSLSYNINLGSKSSIVHQGHTLSSDMTVLDMAPYDVILGYDWLKQHSPMKCDWDTKTLEFEHQG